MSSLEDYLTSIRDEMNAVKKEMGEAKKKVDEFIEFLTSEELFRDWNRFYSLLYEVQNVVTPLVQRLMAFEMSIRRAELMADRKEEKEAVERPTAAAEAEKRGIRQRLISLLRRKRREEKRPERREELESIIQYGQNIIKRLDIIWSEYRKRYYLIMFQDTELEREREHYSTLEFVSYATNVCADIINFVNAAYNMRIAELEAKYESMMKSLATAEASRELPIAKVK